MSTATVPRATGYPVPASGAALNSEPVRTQLVNIVDFLEGGNIAQGNIDVTEVAALAVANTWTANQTYSATLTVGADDTGYDVQFFGATSGKSMLWDESADTLIITGDQTVSGTLGVTGVATFTAQSVHTGGIQAGGNIVSDTDSTDDLGTTGVRWANLYVDDITTTTSAIVNTMTLATGSITDSTGAISFGNENLSTTGTLSAGATTVSSLLASSNDVGAIGASGTAFSDLFLASGGVINFDAGNAVIAHSAAKLAITGATQVGFGGTPSVTGGDGLHIQAGATTNSRVLIESTTSNGYGAIVDFKAKTSGGTTQLWNVGTAILGDAATFSIYNATDTITGLFIDASGNAGVNTTTMGSAIDNDVLGYGRDFAISGGTTNGAVHIGATISADDTNAGTLVFYNSDNSDAGTATSRMIGAIEGIVITSDSNAGDDSGGDLHFRVKPEAGAPYKLAKLTSAGNIVLGTGAISTSATDGFVYIPSTAGAPSGTPTDYNNLSAMVHDTTNNRIYLYDHVSNAWQYAALT